MDQLRLARVNTYVYVINPGTLSNPGASASDLAQLPDLAVAAEQSLISLYVCLVPPSEVEEGLYPPYEWDYIRWASEIGGLARSHPAIKGIVLDDLGANVASRHKTEFYFTDRYVSQMMESARVDAPELSFVPIMYYQDLVGPTAILSEFRAVSQMVIFPYVAGLAGSGSGNTKNPMLVSRQGTVVADLLDCELVSRCVGISFPERPLIVESSDLATVWLPEDSRLGPTAFLSFRVMDDQDLQIMRNYVIRVYVGDRLVYVYMPKAGWTQVKVAIETRREGESVRMVIARLPSKSVGRLTVQIKNVILTTKDEAVLPNQQPVVSAAPVVRSEVVSRIPYLLMTYAVPLSSELGRGASSQYVSEVLESVDQLKNSGKVAGSVIFKLPMPGFTTLGHESNYPVVKSFYSKWR